ncbi:MAG: hypothetical protein KU37_04730 [Sulfuricurvum sp. PC08-66]|nr:MAG: hypothetical protein KU37_04730 [Sulfuricurvum sp. PC08-66]
MRHIVSMVLTLALLGGVEISHTTHGYGRIQSNATPQTQDLCFKGYGAASKYRLGNECETWFEIIGAQEIALESGIVIHNQVRPAFMGKNQEAIDFVRWDEAYVQVEHLLQENSLKLWVGNKIYKRYDSFLSDYFYLNMSGNGLGIEDFSLGQTTTLSYAFIYNLIDPTNTADHKTLLYQSHDLRYEGKTNRGSYAALLNYMYIGSQSFDDGRAIDGFGGVAAGVHYIDEKLTQELLGMEGKNTSAFFVGQGAAKGAFANSAYLQESAIEKLLAAGKGYATAVTARAINHNAFENDAWGMISNLVVEYRDDVSYDTTKQLWFSFGVRPILYVHEYVRWVVEAGFDDVYDLYNTKMYWLLKGSTALELAFHKGIWERPVARLYYTAGYWNGNSQGLVGNTLVANQTNGQTVGVQLEHWW